MKSHYSNHLQVVTLIALAISSALTSSIFAQTNSATTATNRITDPTLRPRPAENKALIDAADQNPDREKIRGDSERAVHVRMK